MASPVCPSQGDGSLLVPMVILVGIWALVVVIVNPLGEFMVNDDWSYVKALERLRSEGSLGPTGWGPAWARGGPALLTHLLWGWLFTAFAGFSLTTLRLAVVAAGFLGSVAMLGTLRAANAPPWAALFGTLTLVLNPLFFSQTFTFMTDVTFTSLAAFSLWFLYAGVRSGKKTVIALGLLFALGSILTRQIGLVIPAAFILACWLHPRGKALGRKHMVGLVAVVTLIPWLAFEYLLFRVGSTPLTEHQAIVGVWQTLVHRGLPEYLNLVYGRIVHAALIYVCALISPVLILSYAEIAANRAFRYIFTILTLGFLIIEGLLIGGAVDLQVAFLPNVITDFGIGPLLLKDTYILGIKRLSGIPTPLYCALVYWALVSVVAWAVLVAGSVTRLVRVRGKLEDSAAGFLALLSLLSGLLYLFIIGLTGFHDRYLIPVCMMFIIWSIAEKVREPDTYPTLPALIAGFVPLLLMGCFAVSAEHDFMEMKRAQKQAHDYLIHDLRADPCLCDGGMEFNGYHCYKPDFAPVAGLSWWWVSQENYVVTLGPLRGYEVVRTYPFHRYLGSDGAVHLLMPSRNPKSNSGRNVFVQRSSPQIMSLEATR
ncbi:MAG: glycosyltransferase family 39 protein [Desulfomonile tiedjei]|nr:glycosyltransferase family 39 protein [Desulfomonile tiedjei]